LQSASLPSYINKQDWEMTTNIVNRRKTGFIHRKDWEWALGIIAMRRFGKLNEKSTALGIGAGREVLFYLANKLKHVYATDLYDGNNWKNFGISKKLYSNIEILILYQRTSYRIYLYISMF
jgi:hypothetical protein